MHSRGCCPALCNICKVSNGSANDAKVADHGELIGKLFLAVSVNKLSANALAAHINDGDGQRVAVHLGIVQLNLFLLEVRVVAHGVTLWPINVNSCHLQFRRMSRLRPQ